MLDSFYNMIILYIIIDWSFKFGQLFRMMSSIARSFKHKMALVLKQSTIVTDKQMVWGTVFHKHNYVSPLQGRETYCFSPTTSICLSVYLSKNCVPSIFLLPLKIFFIHL